MTKLNNMKKIIILLLFVFSSCKQIRVIEGIYLARKSNTKLKLNKNGTFIYQYPTNMYKTESKGTWIKENDSLVLNSYSEYKDNMIEVKEFKNSSSRYIKILDEFNRPIANVANVIITYDNGKKTNFFSTDEQGKITLSENSKVTSIKVVFIESYVYNVIKLDSSFEIKVYTDDLNKIYFNKKILRIKKNHLVYDGEKLFKNLNTPRTL